MCPLIFVGQIVSILSHCGHDIVLVCVSDNYAELIVDGAVNFIVNIIAVPLHFSNRNLRLLVGWMSAIHS